MKAWPKSNKKTMHLITGFNRMKLYFGTTIILINSKSDVLSYLLKVYFEH